MSKVVLGAIFLILAAIGMAALIGLLSPGVMMDSGSGTMTGGVLLGLIVLLGLVAVFVIFN
jgi:hypothetical protein